MSRYVYHIAPLTGEEINAIQMAIVSGALNERMASLRALLRHNREHFSIANGIETEISALASAARAIMDAKGSEH